VEDGMAEQGTDGRKPGASATGRATIADVARLAGVSKGLVSFALNDRPGVSADARERILAAAAELDWSPSVRARSLSTNRSFAIGLVLAREPDIVAADPFFPTFMAGVESELSVAGQALVLATVTPGRQETDTYRSLALDKRVDGVILTDLRAGDERIALLGDLGLAAVTLGHPEVASPYPAVSIDDEAGVTATMEHLAELGHRSIAHVAGPSTMLHAARRRRAFERAAAALGITPRVIETDFSATEGAAATRHLLGDAGDRPTAIVYSNDPMALAGLAVAQRAGLSVPRDLSITGFDNTDLAEHVYPSLTSVATDVAAWGATAARVLLATIVSEPVDNTDLPPARLVVRESTSHAPHRHAPTTTGP
jgi:DNA-binding LacI/PurR family transcriptional regulator